MAPDSVTDGSAPLRWTWIGAASGIGFVLVQFAGFGVGAASRGFERLTLDSTDAAVAEAVSAPVPTAVWVGGYVELIAYLLFIVFTACLTAALRSRPGRSAWPAYAVLAGGVMGVSTSMIGYATEGAAYLRAGEGIDPTVARVLLDVANIAFILVWGALAVLLLAAAASHLLRQWLRVTAAVLGTVFLVAFVQPSLPIGEIADLALWAWVIAACVSLTLQARRSTRTLDLEPEAT